MYYPSLTSQSFAFLNQFLYPRVSDVSISASICRLPERPNNFLRVCAQQCAIRVARSRSQCSPQRAFHVCVRAACGLFRSFGLCSAPSATSIPLLLVLVSGCCTRAQSLHVPTGCDIRPCPSSAECLLRNGCLPFDMCSSGRELSSGGAGAATSARTRVRREARVRTAQASRPAAARAPHTRCARRKETREKLLTQIPSS